MIFAYVVLAIATVWAHVAGSGAHSESSPSRSRRANVLRDAARHHHAARRELETFRDPRSSPVIFASEHWQQLWWCEKLDVTVDALRAAMREVGPMAADVQIHFARRRRKRAIAR